MDKISKKKRSRNMSRIKNRDTKPEILLRRTLWQKGYRYRLHIKIPGKPDINFMSKKKSIFVNGCFWHNHKCRHDHKPKSNTEFWENKIHKNIKRDKNSILNLNKMGWNTLVVWECEILGDISSCTDKIVRFIGD